MPSKKVFIPPEVLAHFKMWDEIKSESDRGSAILAHAYLDSRLRETILARLYRRGDTAKELLKPGGALGEYSARCKAAYCLGLFGKSILRDLTVLGDIRNIFAHRRERKRFQDHDIKMLCDSLTFYRFNSDPETEPDPRERYLRAVSSIGNILQGERDRKDQPKQLPPRFAL